MAGSTKRSAPSSDQPQKKRSNVTNGSAKPFDKKRKFDATKKKEFSGNKVDLDPLTPEAKRLRRREQKQEALKRKEARPHYDTVSAAKKLWERARMRTSSPEERKSVIDKLFNILEDNINEVVLKHDASRVVQTCLKYGTPEQRSRIVAQLKGDILVLSKSQYGHFLAMKLFKFATRKQRIEMMESMKGKVVDFLKHKEASQVIDLVYSDYANVKQRNAMISELYGPEFALFGCTQAAGGGEAIQPKCLADLLEKVPSKRETILKNLGRIVSQLVDKSLFYLSITHRALLEYIENVDLPKKKELITTLIENLPNICHTKDGSMVAVHCLSYGTPKDRKMVLKAFKGLVSKICVGEYSHRAILRIFDVVDDTVLVQKAIISEVKEAMVEISSNKFGRLVPLHCLTNKSSTYFSQTTIALCQPSFFEKADGTKVPTCKKDADKKRTELLSACSETLISECIANASPLVRSIHGSSVLFETVLNATGDVTPILEALVALVGEDDTDDETPVDEQHVMRHLTANRVLKRLVQRSGDEGARDELVKFPSMLFDALEDTVLLWAQQKGAAFVIASLLEAEASKKKARSSLIKSKAKLAQVTGNPGTAVIVNVLSGKASTKK